MPKYVVKNERGEWLSRSAEDTAWTTDRSKRWEHVRKHAFYWARVFGGKVYRVRKVTAKRERERIVEFLRDAAVDAADDSATAALSDAAAQIEGGEHRRRH